MSNQQTQQQQQPKSEYDLAKTIFIVPDEGKIGDDIRRDVHRKHGTDAKVKTNVQLATLREDTVLVFVMRDSMDTTPRADRPEYSKRPLRYVGPFSVGKHWNRAEDKVHYNKLTNELAAKILPCTIKTRSEGPDVGQVMRMRSA